MSFFPAPSFLVFRSPGGAGEHAGSYWVRNCTFFKYRTFAPPVSVRYAAGRLFAGAEMKKSLFSHPAASGRNWITRDIFWGCE